MVAKDCKIGVVNFTLCCSYFVGMDRAIADAAWDKSQGHLRPMPRATPRSSPPMSRTFCSQKVDGLIISGGPLEAAPEALDAAKASARSGQLVDRNFKGSLRGSVPDNYAISMGHGELHGQASRRKGNGRPSCQAVLIALGADQWHAFGG